LAAALCYGLKKDKQGLKAMLAETLETAESNYGPRANETLRALLSRAGFYLNGIRNLDMAESGYVEVLKRCQESSTDIGITHSRLKALKGLMSVAQTRGSYVESERLCYNALDLSTQELGPNHYYTKGLAESLVDLLWVQQRYDKARECAKVYQLNIEAEL
jgi:hypothetical protein